MFKLSLEEHKETIAAFVEEEILYSEVYKRGLDKGDMRIRRNMILNGLCTYYLNPGYR